MSARTATHEPVGSTGDQGTSAAGEGADAGGQSCSLPLGGAGSSGAARAFTRRCLGRWGLDGRAPFTEDAVLVVSELVTNAHQHAETAEALRLRWQPPLLVIEVQDRGKGMPRVCDPTDDLPGGRGLSIVTRLVQQVQVVLGTLGSKTVRAEMSSRPAEEH